MIWSLFISTGTVVPTFYHKFVVILRNTTNLSRDSNPGGGITTLSSSDSVSIILKIGLFLNMELTDRIELNPEVLVGKPVIKGTRISVELILEELGAGNSMEDLLENYPRLEKADVFAALQYGAWALKRTMVYPASA